MKAFNINNYVYVKLNEIGIKELRKQHEDFRKTFPSACDFSLPETDENGYSKFQAHDLMRRFGHMMTLGFGCPFDTEIIFDDKDMYDLPPAPLQ